MKILIVDDDLTNRLLLKRFLKDQGECHVAADGNEALESFTSAHAFGNPYDLVCLDILMPGLDGQETLKRFRAEDKTRGILPENRTRVVMTTALRDMKEVMEAYGSLCDGYLVKPIERAKLLDLLNQLGLTAVGRV